MVKRKEVATAAVRTVEAGKWRRQVIRLATGERGNAIERVQWEAVVQGGLAVHLAYFRSDCADVDDCSRWTVTHVATGLGLFHKRFKSERVARNAAERALAFTDWTKVGQHPSAVLSAKVITLFRDLVKEGAFLPL